jgi:NAD(P)-dependent dehydrogenase (short-subunit alcohol dehydrogenase family)
MNVLGALLWGVVLAAGSHYALRREYATHEPSKSAVLVTGASSGIGRAAALALHAEGFVVFAGVRSEEQFDALRKEACPSASGSACTSRFRPIKLDVTIPAQVDAALEAVARSSAPLVGLVNNAGTTYKRPVETAAVESVRGLIEVNVLGVFSLTQKLLPLLRASRGRVVNVGSVQGIISMPMQAPYAMTKYDGRALRHRRSARLA